MEKWFRLSCSTAAMAARLFLFALIVGTTLNPRAALSGRNEIAAPTLSAGKVAILRLALEIEPTIPFVSANIGGMGRDAGGRWWVQGWTTASPEFKGEPGEQWFIIWDGHKWTHQGHGTGLEREDFEAVSRWRDPPKTEPRTETLITPGYIVLIEWPCPEGYVTCESVRYTSASRKSGETLTLKGRSLHTICADGVTPCRFLGYRFGNGKHSYYVWQDGNGENGTLEVRTGREVLVTERGTWN